MSQKKITAAFSSAGLVLLTTAYVTCAAAISLGVPATDMYYHLLDRDCPGKHLAWLSDAGLDMAIEDFRASLEPPKSAQWDCLADSETACSANAAGFRRQHSTAYISWAGAVGIDILPRLIMKVCSLPVVCVSRRNCSEQH